VHVTLIIYHVYFMDRINCKVILAVFLACHLRARHHGSTACETNNFTDAWAKRQGQTNCTIWLVASHSDTIMCVGEQMANRSVFISYCSESTFNSVVAPPNASALIIVRHTPASWIRQNSADEIISDQSCSIHLIDILASLVPSEKVAVIITFILHTLPTRKHMRLEMSWICNQIYFLVARLLSFVDLCNPPSLAMPGAPHATGTSCAASVDQSGFYGWTIMGSCKHAGLPEFP